MNHVAMTDNDTNYMSPNSQRWRPEPEIEKCSYYCGRIATTNNKGEPCCYECLAEISTNEFESAKDAAKTQDDIMNSNN